MTGTIRSAALIASAAIITTAGVRGGVTAADRDACSLVSPQDAAAALGENVGAPKPMPSHPMGQGATASACVYKGSGFHEMSVQVIRMPTDMAAVYKSLCQQKGKDGLSDLGDVACWYNDKHEELQVLKGLTFFSIVLKRSGNPTEPIKAAAKRVFNQL